MIESTSKTYIKPNAAEFVFAIFKGIEAASELSADYRLDLSATDVSILAENFKKLKHIEIY